MPVVTTSEKPASSAAKNAGGPLLVPSPDECAVAVLSCKDIQRDTVINQI